MQSRTRSTGTKWHAWYSAGVPQRWPCRLFSSRGEDLHEVAVRVAEVSAAAAIPFALVPLIVLTSRAQIMGGHVNRRYTTICACACVAVIISLNVLIVIHE